MRGRRAGIANRSGEVRGRESDVRKITGNHGDGTQKNIRYADYLVVIIAGFLTEQNRLGNVQVT